MSNYTLSTDFTAKDSLISGNPAKLVKGSEISNEFNAVATAVATKIDRTTSSGSAVIPKGTQAQRDVSAEAGYLRFNTSSGAFEGFDGTKWGPVGSNNGPVVDTLTYTATAAQTVFTLSMAYTPGQNQVEVFVNGLLMSLTTDYVETDYQTITFNSGLSVGDEVLFRVWRVDTLVDGDAANMSYLPAGVDAVTTTVQAKLRRAFVDVDDFGGDPTGVSDSYAAILAALATGKKVVLSSNGVYKSSGTIPLAGGKYLFGDGYGAGISYTGSGVGILMTNGGNVINGVHLTTTASATKALHLLGASNNQIRNFIVSGNPANGVYLESTDTAAQTDWNLFEELIVNNAVLPVALVASGTGAVNSNVFRGATNWRTSATSGGVVLYLNGGGYGIVGNNFYDIDLSGYTNNNSVVMDGPGTSQTNFIGIQVDTGSLTGCVIGSGVTSTKWIGGSNQATTPFVQNNTAAQQSNDILLTSSKSFIGSIDIAAYTAPTLLNSWVNYGGGEAVAGYYKDALGIVHIKGLVKSGTTTPGTNIFVLPAGFCPTDSHWFATTSNGSFGAFVVASNGAVYVATAPSNTYFSIECSFRAGA